MKKRLKICESDLEKNCKKFDDLNFKYIKFISQAEKGKIKEQKKTHSLIDDAKAKLSSK